MTLSQGDEAPDFEVQADGGEVIRLAELRGKPVVLYFYPRDDTPGCTKEACGFRDNFGVFEELDAVVLGVSPDSVASHEKFKKKYDLPFRLLADVDHKVAEAYGAWGVKKMYGREFEGVFRKTFVIDAEGRVAQVFPKVSPEGHWEEVRDVVQALES